MNGLLFVSLLVLAAAGLVPAFVAWTERGDFKSTQRWSEGRAALGRSTRRGRR